MNKPKIYRRTVRLVLFFGSILLGLGWSRFTPALSIFYVLLLFLFTIVSFRKARLISLYAFILLGFSVGWWRGGVYMRHVRELASLSKHNVAVTGTVLSDGVYGKNSQLSFDIGGLQLDEPYQKAIVGKIGVSGFGENMVFRGDKVSVSGKFYPARGSVVAYLSYANIKLVAHSHSVAYSITRRFTAGLQNTLPEPLASFSLGLLIGQRNTLPPSITAILSAVGLSHIIAVSGYNLTIMMGASRRLFGKRSKFQTYVGSQALILSFLLVTGLSASIVRAAIISSLSLGAWYYGRTIKPLLLILFAAAATALWNPLYIWSDIGWYLSFLAFFGVLILGPLLRKRLFNGDPRGIIGELIMETLSAQIATLPIILYIFKTSSFVALPANILVVPLIPLAMLLSFIAGLAGMFIAPVAGWLAWPARYVLTYLLDMATMFSRVPHMKISVALSIRGLIIMYTAMLLVLFVLWHKGRKNDTITDINNTKEQHVGTLQMVND